MITETNVAAQAGDEPMRALPHLPRAVGYRHTMDNTEGIKGNKPQVYFSCTKPAPFGIPGLDFSASYPVTTEALFTAEQMKEYARAALKAQPAPTEAQGNTSNNSSRSQLSGNSGELQPSGNTGELVQGEGSARPSQQYQRITAPGQVKVGDQLRFTIGDDTHLVTAKLLLHAGTDKEEIIYNKRQNYYLITSMAIANRGGQKNCEFLARASAQTGGLKS